MTNINSNINQKLFLRQPSQQILRSGQKVYLYGDTRFAGTLIHPVERTHPPRWTVELERGGYDSATIQDITPLNPIFLEPDANIPFSDEPEITAVNNQQITFNSQLEAENNKLREQIQKLEQENKQLNKELSKTKDIIRRAKDISPLKRISLRRVSRLAHDACMDVQKVAGGWMLKMGKLARKFRRLVDIWEILSQDDWSLSDVMAEDKLTPLDQIKLPCRKKVPNHFAKMPKQPFPITREDMLVQRELLSLRYS
ncbi:hypothetical protein Xen7305DRAFT_00045800 [Xenococcus sp. PCC 7305]|uniref:hypothetical protein n=1 Tax=Xenococcus sp. PCC 7305 TaxID=102125 RepID=UPI0002ACE28B|nr:hypothetical protein [Xenococcus sp. PCC 7305]ELS04844.1 hypothetical protein Xen7305DRAFT_00045800 [Xenococcus sp. PCC 7305]